MKEEKVHINHPVLLTEKHDSISGLALFAQLVTELSSSTKTNDKLQSLVDYFATAPDADKVWVIAIFSGRRPRRAVNSRLMREWCAEITNYPSWLFDECYHSVGDLAETLALLLPETKEQDQINKSLSYYLETFISIEKQDEAIRKKFIVDSWNQMNRDERFVFNKLITGSFRIGVSQKTIVNALAKIVDLSSSVIAHRISGNWDPSTTSFNDLLSESASITDFSKPYPFYLAYALEEEPQNLGDPKGWQAEWKWDGIRGQLIKRNNELFVWSRGEELMTDKFPEYFILKDLLPDGVVIDGEIIPAVNGKPLPFSVLQTRIGRKNIGKKQLQEAPIAFFAYDLLEFHQQDFREKSLTVRRNKLEEIVQPLKNNAIQISQIINFNTWDELKEIRKGAREMNSEGIMLKRKDSNYKVGRKRGDWWKWKIDPLTIDCVMVYAQKGSGRRSNLYTDYTFAVKDGDNLVTFTKAYSGLTDKEFAQIDNFVKRNSLEKFGPVRTVKPELVFEIAFEGIAASNRHKSGVALRFPRMSRWRKDKSVDEINTLDDLKQMLNTYGK
ncbi:ATP-dependent DNA ligase [Ginsengibacter hankyongi]|uniref:DNA ligase (ATP) n=1 Tax=Ginsengibacter hankyongi TaxID=2607284 RepID=A0A5J5IIA9_9BACT|nr:ATP-dependent DNA ligase [Ginsengibacter hankyongi]KAA9040759.1 ATP-dependent DNA ligase [Ginsengibacter hankyongi]